MAIRKPTVGYEEARNAAEAKRGRTTMQILIEKKAVSTDAHKEKIQNASKEFEPKVKPSSEEPLTVKKPRAPKLKEKQPTQTKTTEILRLRVPMPAASVSLFFDAIAKKYGNVKAAKAILTRAIDALSEPDSVLGIAENMCLYESEEGEFETNRAVPTFAIKAIRDQFDPFGIQSDRELALIAGHAILSLYFSNSPANPRM